MKKIKEEIELRICYTENQIKQKEYDLRKVQDRIQYLQGELQGYKNIFQDIIEGEKNDRIESK